jgi:hypothetical protein
MVFAPNAHLKEMILMEIDVILVQLHFNKKRELNLSEPLELMEIISILLMTVVILFIGMELFVNKIH